MTDDALSAHAGWPSAALRRLAGGAVYSRAPILEATVDLRVRGDDAASFEESLRGLLSDKDGFNEPVPLFTLSLGDFQKGPFITRTPGTASGLSFRAADGGATVKVGPDRYAYSWTKPYTGWEAFVSEAVRHWDRFRGAVSPTAVESIGVRFVNRIDVPGRDVEVKDYLRTSIELSPYLPQEVSGYFAQVQIPLDGAESRITTSLLDSEDEDRVLLVLDIDVRMTTDLPTAAPSFTNDLLRELGRLRVTKNLLFEACITEATRGLIR